MSEATDAQDAKEGGKGRPTPSRNAARREGGEAAKPNIFRRVVIFISQVISEMKKVTYPTANETWTYFLVVTVFVVAIMAFTGLLDFGLGKLSASVFG